MDIHSDWETVSDCLSFSRTWLLVIYNRFFFTLSFILFLFSFAGPIELRSIVPIRTMAASQNYLSLFLSFFFLDSPFLLLPFLEWSLIMTHHFYTHASLSLSVFFYRLNDYTHYSVYTFFFHSFLLFLSSVLTFNPEFSFRSRGVRMSVLHPSFCSIMLHAISNI